jgi:copper chaperone
MMGVKKTTIFVVDMTCSSCETRITQALGTQDGVIGVKASQSGGRVDIEFDDEKTSIEALKSIIGKTGYTLGKSDRTSAMIAA